MREHIHERRKAKSTKAQNVDRETGGGGISGGGSLGVRILITTAEMSSGSSESKDEMNLLPLPLMGLDCLIRSASSSFSISISY